MKIPQTYRCASEDASDRHRTWIYVSVTSIAVALPPPCVDFGASV